MSAVDLVGKRIFRAAGLDIGGIEYLETGDQRIFYDVNANSNLRPAIAREYRFDPFERVVDWLVAELAGGADPYGHTQAPRATEANLGSYLM